MLVIRNIIKKVLVTVKRFFLSTPHVHDIFDTRENTRYQLRYDCIPICFEFCDEIRRIDAKIHDISLGGICVKISRNAPYIGLNKIHLSFDENDLTIPCRILRTISEEKYRRIFLKFQRMDPQIREQLDRFIQAFSKKEIKKVSAPVFFR